MKTLNDSTATQSNRRQKKALPELRSFVVQRALQGVCLYELSELVGFSYAALHKWCRVHPDWTNRIPNRKARKAILAAERKAKQVMARRDARAEREAEKAKVRVAAAEARRAVRAENQAAARSERASKAQSAAAEARHIAYARKVHLTALAKERTDRVRVERIRLRQLEAVNKLEKIRARADKADALNLDACQLITKVKEACPSGLNLHKVCADLGIQVDELQKACWMTRTPMSSLLTAQR